MAIRTSETIVSKIKTTSGKPRIEVSDVEMGENGIIVDVNLPYKEDPNISKLCKVYIDDTIMLKILSRYIDNDKHEENDGIEDAVY